MFLQNFHASFVEGVPLSAHLVPKTNALICFGRMRMDDWPDATFCIPSTFPTWENWPSSAVKKTKIHLAMSNFPMKWPFGWTWRKEDPVCVPGDGLETAKQSFVAPNGRRIGLRVGRLAKEFAVNVLCHRRAVEEGIGGVCCFGPNWRVHKMRFGQEGGGWRPNYLFASWTWESVN